MLGPEGTPGQGRMRNQRLTNMTVVFAALALCAIAPATAAAGSLLSGYGGPGQGNQAILGSGLVNGPSGGAGGGGSTAAPSAAAVSGEAATGGGAAAATVVVVHPHGGHRSHSRTQAGGAGAHAGNVTPPATSSSSRAGGPDSSGGGTLGFSGSDVVYLLLVVAGLVGTGFVTRRLAQRTEVETRAG